MRTTTKNEAEIKLTELKEKAAKVKIAASAPRENFVEYMTKPLASILRYKADGHRVAVHGNYYGDAVVNVENKLRKYAERKGFDYDTI